MKTFKLAAAQGEITIRRIGDTKDAKHPQNSTLMKGESGRLIIGHSETGHHHTMADAGVSVAVMDRAPEGMRILHMIVEKASSLTHDRGHDTHEAISFEPGEYEIRIQREYDPYAELARQVAD